MNTAIVIGATGLVGTQLTDMLLQDERFDCVKIFVRRHTGRQHSKLLEYVIDFDRAEQWDHWVTGTVLFSALGTTLRKAGSKGAQFKVDYTYQYVFAKIAAQNGVLQYVLVSSAYASPQSRIFYSRIKGNLEQDVRMLPFQRITLIRPGILAGDRKEKRTAEKISIAVLQALHRIPALKKWKPVPACIVAQAMVNACFTQQHRQQIVELEEVFQLAQSY